MIKALATKLSWARRITWASYCLFLLSMVTGSILSGTPASLIVISTLPLLLFLPGLVRENYKSLSLLCFVTLMYFTVMVVKVWEPQRTPVDILSLALIVVLFSAAMMFSRWKQYHLAGLAAR
ncbi:MAG: DUF2069 domain-containing protein [Porticoccaceae bacterium]